MELMEESADDKLLSVPDTLVFLGTNASPTLEVSFGSVDALLASGRFGAIEEPRLRLLVSGFPGHVEDAREMAMSTLGNEVRETLALLDGELERLAR